MPVLALTSFRAQTRTRAAPPVVTPPAFAVMNNGGYLTNVGGYVTNIGGAPSRTLTNGGFVTNDGAFVRNVTAA